MAADLSTTSERSMIAEDLKASMLGSRVVISHREFQAAGTLTKFVIDAEVDSVRRAFTDARVICTGKTAGVTIWIDGEHELHVPIGAKVQVTSTSPEPPPHPLTRS